MIGRSPSAATSPRSRWRSSTRPSTTSRTRGCRSRSPPERLNRRRGHSDSADLHLFAGRDQMVGRSREEIVDKGAAPFTHPKGHRIAKEVHGRLASGEADQVSYVDRYVHKDGRTILVEV